MHNLLLYIYVSIRKQSLLLLLWPHLFLWNMLNKYNLKATNINIWINITWFSTSFQTNARLQPGRGSQVTCPGMRIDGISLQRIVVVLLSGFVERRFIVKYLLKKIKVLVLLNNLQIHCMSYVNTAYDKTHSVLRLV